MRYVVTELEGYSASRRSGLGLSCHVIDTACNRRLVASFRTEDTGGGRRFERTRRYARECCDELNAPRHVLRRAWSACSRVARRCRCSAANGLRRRDA